MKMNVLIFLLASVISRGARFYIVAYASKKGGQMAVDKIMNHADKLGYLFMALLLIGLIWSIVQDVDQNHNFYCRASGGIFLDFKITEGLSQSITIKAVGLRYSEVRTLNVLQALFVSIISIPIFIFCNSVVTERDGKT